MIDDYLPVMSDCDREGMAGNCGDDCPVFMEGDCEHYKEFDENDQSN